MAQHLESTCLATTLLLGITIALAAPLGASEVVVLSTGFRLYVDRHELDGESIKLYNADGVMVLPRALVGRFEADDRGPAPAAEAAVSVQPDLPAESDERPWQEVLAEQAESLALHPALIYSVIAAESNYDPAAVSHKGAIGLMQLMPATAAELAVDPHRADQNVLGGTRYLRALLDRYDGRPDQLVRAVAAYNAGPAAVDRYNGIPPYAETQAFVRRVIQRFLRLAARQ